MNSVHKIIGKIELIRGKKERVILCKINVKFWKVCKCVGEYVNVFVEKEDNSSH